MDTGAAKGRHTGSRSAVQRTYAVGLVDTLTGTGNQTHSHHPFLTSYPDSGTLSAGAGIRAGRDKRIIGRCSAGKDSLAHRGGFYEFSKSLSKERRFWDHINN